MLRNKRGPYDEEKASRGFEKSKVWLAGIFVGQEEAWQNGVFVVFTGRPGWWPHEWMQDGAFVRESRHGSPAHGPTETGHGVD